MGGVGRARLQVGCATPPHALSILNDTVRMLKELRARVLLASRYSRETPLILACMRDDLDAARSLLEGGASVHAKSATSQTALHAAAVWSDGTRLLLSSRGALWTITACI